MLGLSDIRNARVIAVILLVRGQVDILAPWRRNKIERIIAAWRSITCVHSRLLELGQTRLNDAVEKTVMIAWRTDKNRKESFDAGHLT